MTFPGEETDKLTFPIVIGEKIGNGSGYEEKARAARMERHPWLRGAEWFVDAGDRLIEAMDPGSSIIIGIDRQRDRAPTFGVHIESTHSEDDLDDMPGLRRIERRAGELAALIPAKPPFGARIAFTSQDIAVHLRWHHAGQAVLLSHLREDGWHAADMIIMPDRHFRLSDSDLVTRDPFILYALDRVLGGGRLDQGSYIHSAVRRDNEIRVIIGAGGILHPGSSEVA